MFQKLSARGFLDHRDGYWLRSAALLALLSSAATAQAENSDESCTSLGHGTKIGSSTVLSAEFISTGSTTGWDNTKHADLPPFCKIIAVSSPKPSSRILIEVWLPAADKWNGKILGTGNGGAAGRIGTGSLASGLRRGFAVSNTDMGTYPAGAQGIGFSFGNGRPEAIRDWAFRSTHEMAVLTKDLAKRYYRKAAQRSYFTGCSTGGHQALMEAQRYPEDYDGIIVGAPAHNRTHLHVRFAALRQLGLQPGSSLDTPQWKLWKQTMLTACAGKDGGAPGDTFLNQPARCAASPRTLQCKAGQSQDACLSAEQIAALERIYSGTRNPKTGELIYYADARGAEDQVRAIYGDTFFSRDFDVTHWILPASRPSASFDFNKDMAALDRKFPDINAMDTDLNRFAARGGKIIFFHGWEDGLISPLDTLDYFNRLAATKTAKSDFARLYMVPGLAHCVGGSGPSAFGQTADVRHGASEKDDLLGALDLWSTKGIAPGTLVAAQYDGLAILSAPRAEKVTPRATRPVCAYPQVAIYDGSGDRTKASSFTCVSAPAPQIERPAAKYLR